MNPDVGGFILAAGFGTRLKPMTHRFPKALVPLPEGVLADRALGLLRGAGIHHLGINAHHHAEQVNQYAQQNNLVCFHEEKILGTGGYLANLGGFLDRPMVVVNCDAIFEAADGLVNRLVDQHLSDDVPATLVLWQKPDAMAATGFTVSANRVTEIGTGPLMFTGMYALSPMLRDWLTSPGIVPAFRALAAAGQLGFVIHDGDWVDGGTRDGLLTVHRLVSGASATVYPGARVDPTVRLENAVLYAEARVEAGAEIRDTIIFSGHVSRNEKIAGCIIA